MVEMRGAISVSAYSATICGETVVEVSPMNRIAWSAGLTFCTVGGAGMFSGSRRSTAAMAACTSAEAASILRSSTN